MAKVRSRGKFPVMYMRYIVVERERMDGFALEHTTIAHDGIAAPDLLGDEVARLPVNHCGKGAR